MLLLDERITVIADKMRDERVNPKAYVVNGISGCGVAINGTYIFTIDELTSVINDLIALRDIINKETGFTF